MLLSLRESRGFCEVAQANGWVTEVATSLKPD
jgi:hypothetical protein